MAFHRRESADTGPVVLKVIPLTGAAFASHHGPIISLVCAPLFPHPLRPVAPVAQRYHVTSDTLGREFDPGKRDFSH